MPYSKNYPSSLSIWISDKMRDDLDRVSKKERVPKTEIVRCAIDALVRAYDWNYSEHGFEHPVLFPRPIKEPNE